MTGQNVFNNSLAIMLLEPQDAEEYQNNCVPLLNMLIIDSFKENNNIRLAKGMNKLEVIPQITTLNDNIPYEYEFNDILPDGLCYYFFLDGEEEKAQFFLEQYEAKKQHYRSGVLTDVEDLY